MHISCRAIRLLRDHVDQDNYQQQPCFTEDTSLRIGSAWVTCQSSRDHCGPMKGEVEESSGEQGPHNTQFPVPYPGLRILSWLWHWKIFWFIDGFNLSNDFLIQLIIFSCTSLLFLVTSIPSHVTMGWRNYVYNGNKRGLQSEKPASNPNAVY